MLCSWFCFKYLFSCLSTSLAKIEFSKRIGTESETFTLDDVDPIKQQVCLSLLLY